MKNVSITCFLAMALAALTLAEAQAQGKSAASNGQGGGSLNAHLGSDASNTGSASSSDSQSSGTMDLGIGAVGTYGQLGASHSIDLGDSMSLQLYGGADLDPQTKTDSAGALNGRVGLGWKY